MISALGDLSECVNVCVCLTHNYGHAFTDCHENLESKSMVQRWSSTYI